MHPYVEREAAFGRAMLADLTGQKQGVDGKVGPTATGVAGKAKNGVRGPFAPNDVAWADAATDWVAVWDAANAAVQRARRIPI